MKLPCAIDDFSVLLPLYDLGNHSPFARSGWNADHESQQVSLECGETYQAGQQIFNVCLSISPLPRMEHAMINTRTRTME